MAVENGLNLWAGYKPGSNLDAGQDLNQWQGGT